MSESLYDIPTNIIQASPYFIPITILLSLLVTEGSVRWPLYFVFFYILFGDLANYCEKLITKKMFPTTPEFIRPSPPITGCGVFKDCNANGSKTFGFPSGHAQITTLAAMFWSLYVYRQTSLSTTHKIIRISIMWILAILVWYSRVYIGCHNWIQISGGVVMGSLFGILSYFIVEDICAPKK